MSGLYLPYQEIFTRSLANENIHYDVDESLWPNPQDKADKTQKSSEEHSSWHFTVGL